LLNARYVKSFVIGNKNDFNDAQAIFDAVTRPNKRTVAIKTLEQQDIQMLHSLRQGLVDQRTALVNQLRGLLNERGVVIVGSVGAADLPTELCVRVRTRLLHKTNSILKPIQSFF